MLLSLFRRPRIRSRSFACAASIIALSAAFAASPERGPWPIEAKPGAVAGAVWGTLDNGLRYAALPMTSGGASVSMRLVVDAGSAMDPDEQSGMARLLSRMPLAGTQHFDDRALLEYFLANGLALSSEAFAETSLWRTVYRLDLERPVDGALDKGLQLFGDIADGLALAPEDVSLERDVLAREGAGYRNESEARLEQVLFKDSPYSPEDYDASALGAVTPEQLRAFWQRWYTPDRMTLLVVGDIDPATVEAAIASRFGGLASSDAAKAPRPDSGKRRDGGGVDMVEGEGISSRISLSYGFDAANALSNSGQKRLAGLRLIGAYAQSLFDQDYVLNDDAVTIYRGHGLFELRGFGNFMMMQEQLKTMDSIALRLHEKGIEPAKLKELVTEYLLETRRSLRERPAAEIQRLLQSTISGEPYLPRAAYLKELESALSSLDAEYVSELCREVFNPKKFQYVLSVSSAMGLSGKAVEKGLKGMRKTYNFAWSAENKPSTSWQVKQGFGESGMVVQTKRSGVGEYHLLQYAFQNSFRMNILQTDETPGTFRIRLSIGNGMTDLVDPFPGAEYFARSLLSKTLLGRESQTSLWNVLRGRGLRNIETGVSLEQVYWTATGDTGEDLYEFMALLTEWIYVSRVAEKDFDELMEQTEALTKRAGESLAIEREDALRFKDEPRLRGLFTAEEAEAVSFGRLSEWLNEAAASGYLELTVVGDIEPRKALLDARKTFGALPKREGKVVQPRHGAAVRLAEPGVKSETIDWQSDTALISIHWPLRGDYECADRVRLDSLSELFAHFLANEQKKGDELLLYPRIEISGDAMAPGSIGLAMRFRSPRERVDSATDRGRELAEQFVAWLTPEIVEAAGRGSLALRNRRDRQTSTLMDLLDQSQGRPVALDCYQEAPKRLTSDFEYEAFTETAREMLDRSNARVVSIRPSDGAPVRSSRR